MGFILLAAEDDPVDDTKTDLGGTNIAECESESIISSINIRGVVGHQSVGTKIMAVLLKAPDGTAPADLTATNLMSADMTQAQRDFRANILWRRIFVIPGEDQQEWFKIKLNRKRQVLRRLGKMHDGDSLILRFFNTDGSTAGTLNALYGTIVTRR